MRNTFDAVDLFGKPINIGDKILFTTNDRQSGLNYGEVLDIYVSQGAYSQVKRISIRRLNLDGSVKTNRKYLGGWPAGDPRNYADGTPIQKSTLDYYSGKFYALEK